MTHLEPTNDFLNLLCEASQYWYSETVPELGGFSHCKDQPETKGQTGATAEMQMDREAGERCEGGGKD